MFAHEADKVSFNFSTCRQNNHGKSLLYTGLGFAIPPKKY